MTHLEKCRLVLRAAEDEIDLLNNELATVREENRRLRSGLKHPRIVEYTATSLATLNNQTDWPKVGLLSDLMHAATPQEREQQVAALRLLEEMEVKGSRPN